MVQELGQGIRLVAGVERVAVQRLGVAIGPELAIGVVLEVVEVADGGQRDRIGLVEDRVVVEQPLLVAADLDRWVEDAPDLLADVELDAVVGRRRTDAAVAPLLQLDDDRVLGARRGVAGEHRVEPPARVAELVLEDDAVVVQLGLVDEHRQRHEAVLPARHLERRGLVADLRRCTRRAASLRSDASAHRPETARSSRRIASRVSWPPRGGAARSSGNWRIGPYWQAWQGLLAERLPSASSDPSTSQKVDQCSGFDGTRGGRSCSSH